MGVEDGGPILGHGTLLDVGAELPSHVGFATRRSGDAAVELSEVEAALLHPRAVSERKETFRLGRSAAHAALAGIGRDEGPILAGANREPVWPPGVVGSISHVRGLAAAMVAPAAHCDGIGIDIEVRRRAPELEDQVPRSEERQWLDAASPAQRDDMLLALFSAKESIFKAFFPRFGSFFGFHAALLEPTSSGFTGSLVEDIDSEYPSTRKFDISCRWFGPMVMTWLILPGSAPIPD